MCQITHSTYIYSLTLMKLNDIIHNFAGDGSELLCIQREMLELMKQDVAIKQKMLQKFEEFVACKKRKLDLQVENAKGQTYFEL